MTARTYDSVTETDYDTFLVQDFSVYPPVYRLVEERKKRFPQLVWTNPRPPRCRNW
jgi:hypothetical protein